MSSTLTFNDQGVINVDPSVVTAISPIIVTSAGPMGGVYEADRGIQVEVTGEAGHYVLPLWKYFPESAASAGSPANAECP